MRKKPLMQRLSLGLRQQAHQVQVIVPNGSKQAVLGTLHPTVEHLRGAASEHGGGARTAPRRQQPAAIELPLPVRSQTILSHQLPPQVQARLNGGMVEQASARQQDDDASTVQRLLPE